MKKVIAFGLALICQGVVAVAQDANPDVVVSVITNFAPTAVKAPDTDQLLKNWIRRKVQTPKGRVEIHGKVVRTTIDATSKTASQEHADGTVYVVPLEIKTNTVNVAARKAARERYRQARQAREDSLKSKRQREAEAMMRKLKEQTITIEKNGNTGKETVK